uniref:Uncharacterized protein n=1 Tax=Tanacetum cinerariifolium TaxID=118510 RepID=A0A6L2MF64_TANCI|nr:hypothetical protein [Tanacetum cinerariifolium]
MLLVKNYRFGCNVTILNTIDQLGKFDGKSDSGFLVGYSLNSKAFRVYNLETKRVEENLHKELKKLKRQEKEANDAARKETTHETQDVNTNSTNLLNAVSAPVSDVGPSRALNDDEPSYPDNPSMSHLEDIYASPSAGIFTNSSYDNEGVVTNFNNLETTVNVSPTPTTRIHTIHPKTQILRDHMSAVRTRSKVKKNFEPHAFKVWVLVDLYFGKIGTKWVYRNNKNERGVVVRNKVRLVAQGHRREDGIDYDEVFAPVARIEAIRIFLAFASYMGFIVYQMDVKSAFLYGTIDEEVYVIQPPGFVDPKFSNKVYKVVKALYGLHQAPRAWSSKRKMKPLVKDEEAADVDVNLYRSMIGSLMYLTASRPDIMFTVCACLRFQVTPKTSHLQAVKRIFRYLKGQPKLGLWKSTIGGCQFLGRRLISWQCKKQTIMANSTIEAEYVAVVHCRGQVLWIQNQLLDYGFNLMNTNIYIDNESTICIVKNPVFHSKSKHIEIRHHFIRDAYEKKLIQVLKIHTNDNVAALLTKGFDVSSKELASPKQTALGKDESNPLIVDSLLKTIWSSMHHVIAIKQWLFQRNDCCALVLKPPPGMNLAALWHQQSSALPQTRSLTSQGEAQDDVSIPTAPSTFKPYKKHKSKKQQPITPKVPSLAPSPQHTIPSPTNDLIPDADKDSLKFQELMDLYIRLVHKLEEEIRILKETSFKSAKVDTATPAKAYNLDLQHSEKVLSMQDTDEEKPTKVEEVLKVVKAIKLMTEVVTNAQPATTAAQVPMPSDPRRRRYVIIQDPEETTTLVIVHSEVQSKEKGKGILIEEPKPLKGQVQIDMDEAFARQLEAELNANGNQNDVIEQVKRSEKQDNAVMKYQPLKRKHVTDAQARKNMMIYLKNMAGFKIDFFKGMTYSEIRPIFEKHYNSIQAFLKKEEEEVTVQEKIQEPKPLKGQAQIDMDEAFARQLEVELNANINWNDVIEQVKRNEKQDNAETTKKQRMDEEAEELKRHLQIVANNDDDVYTEATPLASKKLVKKRFETTEPKNYSDDFLLNTLKIMFEKPNVEANVWRDQKSRYRLAKVKSWKLFESYGVHIIAFITTQTILLVEKKYPLTHFTLQQMLDNVRLEIKEDSEMSLELLRLVRR